MFKCLRYVCLITLAAMVIIMGGVAQADMASPHVIHAVQPDGTKIALHIRGSHALHWQEDLNGYTVVRERGSAGADASGRTRWTNPGRGVDRSAVLGIRATNPPEPGGPGSF